MPSPAARRFDERVHALRPHPGQVETAAISAQLLDGSALIDIPITWCRASAPWTPRPGAPTGQRRTLRHRLGLCAARAQRHGREAFYQRFLPFRGGKKCSRRTPIRLRCMPQVHGAVAMPGAGLRGSSMIELNSVTDNPLVFPDADPSTIEDQVISAGHFHGMPLALAMSYLKAAIPVLASISASGA
jgi:histidine ammonia-lyase